jgi:hypothetical protein
MPSRGWLPAIALMACSVAHAAAATCPGPASMVVVAENLSSDHAVTLHVEGQLLDPAATCHGGGANSYTATLDCPGAGVVRCGRVDGLRPGAWVHRVRAQVAGSEEQAQSQRSTVLAGPPPGTNTVSWTAYPRTFVVHQADGDTFRGVLDDAAAFTAAAPGTRALVTFDPNVFQGADHPPDDPVAVDSQDQNWRMSARTTSTAPTAGRPATASPARASSSTRSTPSRAQAASSCPSISARARCCESPAATMCCEGSSCRAA